MQRRVEFLVKNQKIVGDLHLPDRIERPCPFMICSHGRDTNRKRGKWPIIAERFPKEGLAVITFDHRGAIGGESEGVFEETALASRVEDLEAAIEYSKTIPEIDQDKIILLGSSLGGKTVLSVAAREERVKGLILLATPYSEECQKIKCPTLILHGVLDEQVPRHHAHVLKKAISNAECRLIEIEGGDHAFTDSEKLNQVLASISDWLKKLFGKEVKK